MKIKSLISSSVIVSGLLSSTAFSKPTEDYPDNIALLKHERGIQYKNAWRKTLLPVPFPLIINNIYSGTNGWKKYGKVDNMYELYKSAELVVDTVDNNKKKNDKKYLKSYNRVHHFLLKLKEESREAAASKNGIVERQESQKQLDDKIAGMTTEDLARLLSAANKTIPQTCGRPEAGVARFDGHSLRFKIRNVSLYGDERNNSMSMLEFEIDQEKKEIAAESVQNSEEASNQEEVSVDENQEPVPKQALSSESDSHGPKASEVEIDPEASEVVPTPEAGEVEIDPETGKVEPDPKAGEVEPAPTNKAVETMSGSTTKEEPTKEDTDNFEEQIKQVELELANQISQE